MRRLCFGSYVKVLTLCKSAVGKSQKNICGTVILSLSPVNYDIRTDDAKTSDLVLCRAVLPPDIVDLASKIDAQADKSALTDYFKTNVLLQVDSNKKSDVVLALKNIIANDTEIKPDTVVDKVAGLTKADIASTDTFVLVDFLAGVFLYAVTVVINTEGKVSASTINKDYMSQFADKESELKLVDKLDFASSTNQSASQEVNSSEEFDGAYWHESNKTSDNQNQTVNNTAFIFQQYGTDNKQIVGNIETLIINNKGE